MSSYVTEYTSRYKLHYSAAGQTHDMVVRYSNPTDPPGNAFLLGLIDFLNAMAGFRFTNWSIISESWAKKGDTFFLPLTTPLPAGVNPGTRPVTQPDTEGTGFSTFTYLGTDGQPGTVYLFGVGYVQITPGVIPAANWRITTAEDPDILAAVGALQSLPGLVTRSGVDGYFHSYANFKYHAHFVDKVR